MRMARPKQKKSQNTQKYNKQKETAALAAEDSSKETAGPVNENASTGIVKRRQMFEFIRFKISIFSAAVQR